MKRKKYIKLLMGRYCMERNKAAVLADSIQRRSGTYATDLREYDLTVKEWANNFGVSVSWLLHREKGGRKAYRRYLKSQKRALRLTVYTHQNKPGPSARVTVSVGRLQPYDVSLVAAGGYPLGGGGHE